MHDQISIRKHQPTDEEFLYACWLNHFKHSSYFAKRIRATTFYKEHHTLIERILRRKPTILVAHPTGEPDVILGFVVFEGTDEAPIIHFTFVKRAFREMGVARELLRDVHVGKASFTHWTKDVDWIIKKFPDMIYNPYMSWERK